MFRLKIIFKKAHSLNSLLVLSAWNAKLLSKIRSMFITEAKNCFGAFIPNSIIWDKQIRHRNMFPYINLFDYVTSKLPKLQAFLFIVDSFNFLTCSGANIAITHLTYYQNYSSI